MVQACLDNLITRRILVQRSSRTRNSMISLSSTRVYTYARVVTHHVPDETLDIVHVFLRVLCCGFLNVGRVKLLFINLLIVETVLRRHKLR